MECTSISAFKKLVSIDDSSYLHATGTFHGLFDLYGSFTSPYSHSIVAGGLVLMS